MPLSEALARMPEMKDIRKQGEEEEDDDDDDEEDSHDPEVVYFDADTTIDRAQWRVIQDTLESLPPIAVNGNLFFHGDFSMDGCIRGDLHCNVLRGSNAVLVGGTVFAKRYAFFSAEDHEALEHGYPMTLHTPFVFAWFHDVSHLKLASDTVLDVLCGWRDYEKMGVENPHFFWHESLFALKPELCYKAHSDYSDAPYWHFEAIEKCLAHRESLFIDGFDPASLVWKSKADALREAGDLREALAAYQRALVLSPAWYPAWFAAGLTLFSAGAYEQALAVCQKAIPLFPPRHKNIENMAADYAAMSAVRLRRLDLAIELATFSIESTKENGHDQDKRYLPYRVRGEAHMLGGDWEKARTDLTQAAQWAEGNGVTNWLLGRVHHQFDDYQQAKRCQQIALRKNAEKFAADYASHADADFAYKPPTEVDWPLT